MAATNFILLLQTKNLYKSTGCGLAATNATNQFSFCSTLKALYGKGYRVFATKLQVFSTSTHYYLYAKVVISYNTAVVWTYKTGVILGCAGMKKHR